ncbi:MAG: hypothetical protein PHV77_05240 [Candidatus Omnitrophica bacterium]|nr:hypothetical protein [Candidatus Omnitrophota bacterium]
MIELDISIAVALYLLVTVVLVLLIWFFSDKNTRPKQYASEKRHIWQCEVCFFSYVDSRHDIISMCPRCGSFNKRKAQDA